uniref:MFS domain-containing protein n=1 Tax=Rhabditophanes sp. KR3021 TaxID=114890 RepID=A0AC35U5Z5_9BILA
MDEDQEDVTEKSVCLKKRKESALESPKSEKNKKMLTESKQKNKKRTYDMSAWFTDYMINGQILSHTPLLQKNREMNDDDNESMCSESSSGSSSTSAIPEALDGGYGWVIVLCSFFIHFICDGISFSFGVIFPEIQKNFGTNKFVSSIPGSLFLSIPLLGGPIAALLTDLYDCRAMTIVGALIATFGVILSYFSTGIVSFTICYGIITAFGLCLCFNTAIVIVTYYFEKKRALATAIACCGTGAGTIIYPPLCELLISHLGWHSFLLCQAGWLLLLTVCGFFIRDVEWPQDSLEYKREKFIRKMERKRLRKQRQECNYNNQFFDHPYNAFYIPTVLQYKNRLALSLPEIPTHHRLTIKKAELGNSSASIHDGVYKTLLQEEMFTHLRSKSYGNFLRDNRKNSNESKKENKLLKRIESTALEIEKNENLLHLDLECGSLFNGKISQSKGCSTLSHSLNALDLQISSEEENSLGITSSVSSDEEDDCSNKSVDGESRYQKEVESVCSPKNTGTVKFMDKNPLSNMKMTGLNTELENTMSPRDAFLATQPNQPNRLSSLISATLTSTHGRVPATNALIACGQRMNRANIMNHHFKNKVPSAPNIFIKRRKRLQMHKGDLQTGILQVLKDLFTNNEGYTNQNKYLLFLNTFENLPIFNSLSMEKYDKSYSSKPLTPHIYELARSALLRSRFSKKDVTIFLTGSSNSGKTYNLYQILHYFANTTLNTSLNFIQIASIQTLMENFFAAGDESDISLLYKVKTDVSAIKGLEIKRIFSTNYNRLICLNEGVKNFNIFYTVVYGMDSEDKEKNYLKDNYNYFLLNNFSVSASDAFQHRSNYLELIEALKLLKFTNEHITSIFKVISSCILLGNISFRVDNNTKAKYVKVTTTNELFYVSQLLNIEFDDLMLAFTPENTSNNIEKALLLRDSFIDTLYTSLLDWILFRVSDHTEDNNTNSIYMFDTKGYISKSYNTYDDFCINIVNETLMSVFFNNKTHLTSTTSCESFDTANYNLSCLDIVSEQQLSILSILNNECLFPKSSAHHFLEKCDINFIAKNTYMNSRSKNQKEFGLKHYFGVQYYDINDFIAQNKKNLFSVVNETLTTTENPSIASIFTCLKKETNSNGKKFSFVASEILNSLNETISTLLATDMLFVCCLKINAKKEPKFLDNNLIIKQLKSQGLCELMEIGYKGYNHKKKIDNFIKHFKCILPINSIANKNEGQICKAVLVAQGIHYENEYLIENGYVFLNESVMRRLEFVKFMRTLKAVNDIQRYYRGYKFRREFIRVKNAAIKIQSLVRRKIAINFVEALKEKRKNDLEARRRWLIEQGFKTMMPIDENNNPLTDNSNKTRQIAYVEDFMPLKKVLTQHDVQEVSLEEFASERIKYISLGSRRDPIMTSFLPMDNEEDHEAALFVFKEILSFMFSNEDNEQSIRFILQAGINSIPIRDEIFIQLCNQTYNNKDKKATDKAWLLVLFCVNSFAPSLRVLQVLMSHIHKQGKSFQTQLLNALFRRLQNNIPNPCRKESLTDLEIISLSKKISSVLNTLTQDKKNVYIESDSWTTAGEIAKTVLDHLDIADVEGWSVNVTSDDLTIKLSEDDFIFDVIELHEKDLIREQKDSYFFYLTELERIKAPKVIDNQGEEIYGTLTQKNNPSTKISGMDQVMSPKSLRRVYVMDTNDFKDESYNNSPSTLRRSSPPQYDNKYDQNGNNSGNQNYNPSSSGTNSSAMSRQVDPIDEEDVEKFLNEVFDEVLSSPYGTQNSHSTSKLAKSLKESEKHGAIVYDLAPSVCFTPSVFRRIIQPNVVYNNKSYNSLNAPTIPKHGNLMTNNNIMSNVKNSTSNLSTVSLYNPLEKLLPPKLKRSSSHGITTYPQTSQILLRKELFYPGEVLEEIELDLVYLQIIGDCKQNNPYVISKTERESANKILRQNKLGINDIDDPRKVPFDVKMTVVDNARMWPFYFSRMYTVYKVNEMLPYLVIISENGVFICYENTEKANTDPIEILDHFTFDQIYEVNVDAKGGIQIALLNNQIHFFYSQDGDKIHILLNKYIYPNNRSKVYVYAMTDYSTNQGELLNFAKTDKIQLIANHYASPPLPGDNWCYGKCNGIYGWFSMEYVSFSDDVDNLSSIYESNQQPETGPAFSSHDYDYHSGREQSNAPLRYRSKSYDNREDVFNTRGGDAFLHSNQHDSTYFTNDRQNNPNLTLPRNPKQFGGDNRQQQYNDAYEFHRYQGDSSKSPRKDDQSLYEARDDQHRGNYNYPNNRNPNVQESYDRQVKMSRSMSALPPVRRTQTEYSSTFYPPVDYPTYGHSPYKTPYRDNNEDMHYSSNAIHNSQQFANSGNANQQYSSSGKYGGGNYMESSYSKSGKQQSGNIPVVPVMPQTVANQTQSYTKASKSGGGGGYSRAFASSSSKQRYGASSGNVQEIIGYDQSGRPIYQQKHYKVNCCCFNFKWPLWSVEPCQPPQRMYQKPADGNSFQGNFNDPHYPRHPN